MKVFISIMRDRADSFIAEVPGLPGCSSRGNSYSEALTNIKETIRKRLDSTDVEAELCTCHLNSLLRSAGLSHDELSGCEQKM